MRIATRTHGTRRILGTDWPVYDTLDRVTRGSRPRWIVTRNLCNGVPDIAEVYRTRAAALAALGTPDSTL